MHNVFDTNSVATSAVTSRSFARQWQLIAATVLLSVGFASESIAQTRYVTDELVITVRTGPTTQNAIIESLNTGDSVTVLEEDADAGYMRVRTESGAEGWALSRYLVDAPVARDRLSGAESELAQARETLTDLRAQVADLTDRLDSTTSRMEEAETAATSLNEELVDMRSVSANAVTIRDQNESLRRRLNERDALVDRLTTENAALASRSDREWFVLGAGVLVAGIVLGLIIPSLKRKRRRDW
jgi:SH3 domain protein